VVALFDAPRKGDARRVLRDMEEFPKERVALSAGDLAGRAKALSLMSAAGLDVGFDAALNVVGLLSPASSSEAGVLCIGSHLDTVPAGGAYDGLLGVLAGIELVRVFTQADARLRHGIAVIGFSDEEGSVTLGCFGSRWMLGMLTEGERSLLETAASRLSQGLAEGRAELLQQGFRYLPCEEVEALRKTMAAYLELHVEQAPTLDEMGVSTAAVSSIAGIERYEVRFEGASGHAGTADMDNRDDALEKATQLMRSLWSRIRGGVLEVKANVGDVRVLPGTFNVIPKEVTLSVEIRAPNDDALEAGGRLLRSLALNAGGTATRISREDPVVLDARIQSAILDTAAEIAVPCMSLSSWAGHDAGYFARLVPTGMVFVPSVGGHSHCEREYTGPQDVQAGLELLIGTAAKLDAELGDNFGE